MSTLLYPTDVINKNFKLEDRKVLFEEAEKAIHNLGIKILFKPYVLDDIHNTCDIS